MDSEADQGSLHHHEGAASQESYQNNRSCNKAGNPPDRSLGPAYVQGACAGLWAEQQVGSSGYEL